MPGRPLTYLVSGAPDIYPTHEILRQTRRVVHHDNEVSDSAARALRKNRAYVVVAHGSADGTVTWHKTAGDSTAKWLWIGMQHPPRKSRVYLYACSAGTRLVPFLKHCEVFGHSNVVLMPIGKYRGPVLQFLGRVDQLLRGSPYSVENWRTELAKYVNAALAREARKPNSEFEKIAVWMFLRRSLEYVDP